MKPIERERAMKVDIKAIMKALDRKGIPYVIITSRDISTVIDLGYTENPEPELTDEEMKAVFVKLKTEYLKDAAVYAICRAIEVVVDRRTERKEP